MHRALPEPAGSGVFRLYLDQAAQAGPLRGVRDPLAEAGAVQGRTGVPLAATAVALDGLAAVLLLRPEGPLHLPVEGALGCLRAST